MKQCSGYQWARVFLHTNLTWLLFCPSRSRIKLDSSLSFKTDSDRNIHIWATFCLYSSWSWRLRAVGQMRGCRFLALCHAQLAWEGKMGDANLVNGAQMGAMCRPSQMAPTTCLLCLAGNHCPAWQESIYLYCPLASFEVATAAEAQVLFRATKCHGGDPRPSISGGYLTDPLYLSRLKGLLRIIIQSEISES